MAQFEMKIATGKIRLSKWSKGTRCHIEPFTKLQHSELPLYMREGEVPWLHTKVVGYRCQAKGDRLQVTSSFHSYQLKASVS